MNIDKLEAGHELDRLIAEKVMGWRKVFDEDQGDGMWILWVQQDGQEIYDQQLPKFSADIAAAWEVVEKLSQGESMVTVRTDRTALRWICIAETSTRTFSANESTAPLAICRAALKVVGASK